MKNKAEFIFTIIVMGALLACLMVSAYNAARLADQVEIKAALDTAEKWKHVAEQWESAQQKWEANYNEMEKAAKQNEETVLQLLKENQALLARIGVAR